MANSRPPHNLNKTLEAQAKEQPTLTTPLLPKTKKEKHKHKHGSNKNCPACRKNAELAAAVEAARAARAEEAAKAANQISSSMESSSLDREGDSQSDPIEHSKKTLLATKGRVVKNAKRFIHSESGGNDLKQQQKTSSVPEISEDMKKAGLAAKAQVIKNANLVRDFQREASQEIQHRYDSVKQAGLTKSARVVKNANRILGPRDQEHQALRQSEYEDDVVEYLESQDCRHRNRNRTM